MSAHGEHKGREWWKVSARRWAYLSILTLLGLAVCLLLHPFLLRANAWLQGLFSLWPWFIQVALLLPFIIAPWAFLVHRGGLQFGWFVVPKVSWRYPPAWLAGAVGAFAYLLITRVFYPVLGKHALSWEVGYLVLALAAGWALVGVCSHFMCRAKAETETDETESSAESGTKDDLDALVKDPEKLIEWIMQKDSLTHPNGDLFGAAACARRVARRLLDRERAITIGLVGAYGSGKSSIINMARHYVKKPAQLREAPGSEDLPLVTDDESKTVASASSGDGGSAKALLPSTFSRPLSMSYPGT